MKKLIVAFAIAASATLVIASFAQASGDPSSNAKLLLRARQLAQGVRHHGPVSLLGPASSGSGGALAASADNRTWRVEDRGGAYTVTTGRFRSLRTVSVLGADMAKARVGQPVRVDLWYLDPGRGLKTVDAHRLRLRVHAMRPTTDPNVKRSAAAAAGRLGLDASSWWSNGDATASQYIPITCIDSTSKPFLSWPYGPFLNAWSYIHCDGYGIWSQGLFVSIKRVSYPGGIISTGGGLFYGRDASGATSTPCHVGGQVDFQTEMFDHITRIYSASYDYVVATDLSRFWCSNPF